MGGGDRCSRLVQRFHARQAAQRRGEFQHRLGGLTECGGQPMANSRFSGPDCVGKALPTQVAILDDEGTDAAR